MPHRGKPLVQFPPDHGGHQFGGAGAVRIELRLLAAVPQHDDAIGDRVDLVESMGDQDHALALFPQRPDGAQQLFGFRAAQGRGRFIENEQFGIDRDGPDDLHHLLLGHAERAHQGGGIQGEVQFQPGQQFPGPAHLGGLAAEQATPVSVGPRQVDVLGDAHLGDQIELLQDDGDPMLQGVQGRSEMYRLATPQHLAGIAIGDPGNDLAKRGFAGPVLPDQGDHLARGDMQIDIGQCPGRPVALGDGGGDQGRR